MTRDRASIAVLLSALLLAPGAAHAGETDYLPDNVAWNGTSELADVARGLQLRVELLDELDWAQLPPRATLLILYPRGELDPLELTAYLGRGGKVLLADDFGVAGPLLEKLGVRRQDASGLSAARYHDGNRNLPVATTGPAAHTITTGVREIVTNHPAYFTSPLPTLAGFATGQQLLVAATVGEGSFVALADPSVLINGMLRFQGNLTLATNLLLHLRPREGGVIYVLTGSFRVRASAEQRPLAARTGPAQRFLTEYNKFLGDLSDLALTAPALRALALVCGCLTLVGLLLFLPLPRRDLEGDWLRPQGAQRWGFEDQVMRFGGGRGSAASAVPAMVLREELEEILTEALQAPGPIFTIHPGWVVRQVRERAGEQAGHLAARLLEALRQVPQELREAEGLAPPRGLRGKDLAQLYDLSRALLLALGLDGFALHRGASEGREQGEAALHRGASEGREQGEAALHRGASEGAELLTAPGEEQPPPRRGASQG